MRMKKTSKPKRYRSVSKFEKLEKMIQVVEPLAPEVVGLKPDSFSVQFTVADAKGFYEKNQLSRS